MGQRLNIEIIEDSQRIATSYYHWGAYTSFAIELTETILNSISLLERKYSNKKLLAIRLLEATGARLTEVALEKAKEEFPDSEFENENLNRNDGLIDITEEEMDTTFYWEESNVSIELNDRSVKFDVFYILQRDDYEKECEEDFKQLEFYNIDFADYYQLKKVLEKTGGNSFAVGDKVVCVIE